MASHPVWGQHGLMDICLSVLEHLRVGASAEMAKVFIRNLAAFVCAFA